MEEKERTKQEWIEYYQSRADLHFGYNKNSKAGRHFEKAVKKLKRELKQESKQKHFS